ncbi:hypothetical protein N7468_010378 [Penicillium chermesinum]|uniref:Uncharacterized protein n=1 Tax=Penicillium chermesinum TaxID=63820 RepID=A0A9W9TDA7_9EURO|nr:uncharacterized protein N7468_010378 [Penicillium chermesinum]KAJ5217370.1 hypothetical protein N7468_010378 [Penicillium chermesinum]KAJ6171019.1 hypothetical protein N7470_000086 [Penicillium chermesinum]
MSHFFPTTEYAEDQTLSRTILTTHVLSRGFELGSAIGLLSRGTRSLIKRQSPTAASLLRAASTGGIIGTCCVGVGLVGRMWGREEIEWKDRSWRLRNNQGQLAIDNWSEPAAALGAVAGASGYFSGPTGWRGVVGGAGVGSLVGVIGCMCASRIFPSRD